MLVARWQDIGITLEQMQDWKSGDHQHGMTYRFFDGISAANCATYLLYLIARTIFNDSGNIRSIFRTKKSLGEIVLLEAEDTGQRCMDHQPIVKPTAILTRIPATEFIDWKSLKTEKEVNPGPAFAKIRDLLDAEHHQEYPYLGKLKYFGYVALDHDEEKVRSTMNSDEFKEYLIKKYGTEWFRG